MKRNKEMILRDAASRMVFRPERYSPEVALKWTLKYEEHVADAKQQALVRRSA